MTIKELINSCNFEQVKEKIALHYGTEQLDFYDKLYTELTCMQTKPTDEILHIYINAYEEHDDGDELTETFDENDTSLFYDVSAYENGDETVYSISASSYSDFLQYEIDTDTMHKFSAETILAHCLWEITCYSFDDNC